MTMSYVFRMILLYPTVISEICHHEHGNYYW